MPADQLVDQYQDALWQLLPQGLAWTRLAGGPRDQFLRGLAVEPARVDDRIREFLQQMLPSLTHELLSEWEEFLGLPDACEPADAEFTLERRRAAIVARLRTIVSPSPGYFIDLAASLGYEITIEECHPFTTESTCDLPIYDDAWAYVWIVAGRGDQQQWFTTLSTVDERLSSGEPNPLECLFGKLKPSHTIVLFEFT